MRRAWAALLVLRDQRPEGMAPMTWLAVWAFLHNLGRYARFAVIYPDQDQLAEDTGINRAAVRKLIDHAEAAGLIKREPMRNLYGKWNLTSYTLTWVEVAEKLTEAEKLAKRTDPGMGAETARSIGLLESNGEPSTNGLLESIGRTPGVHGDGLQESIRRSLPSGEKRTTVVPFGNDSISNSQAAAADAHTQPAEPQPKPKLKPNRDPGPCVVCGKWVEAGAGSFQRGEESYLEPVHLGCHGSRPGSGDPVERGPAPGLVRRGPSADERGDQEAGRGEGPWTGAITWRPWPPGPASGPRTSPRSTWTA